MRLPESLIKSNRVLAVVTVVVFCLGFGFGTTLVNGLALHGVVVEGHSMDPAMKDGSYLLISNETDVERCDIIIFWSSHEDSYIGHRLVEINENNRYLTKGDNNTYIDQRVGYDTVPRSAVMGEVILEVNILEPRIDVPYLFRSEGGQKCARGTPA